MKMLKFLALCAMFSVSPSSIILAQPDIPVEQWTGKTILLVGAHPDDDAQSYGTLAMLQANGNEVYVLLLTTGNVGTKDPKMTRDRLAKIRRQEELDALAELGIPADHYINLGYTDGMVEFANREEVVKRLVRWYRKIRPDVLFSFEPGFGYQRWHKADHRAAAYLAVDAARAAEWRLIFPGQIIHEGLTEHQVGAYMFYSATEPNTEVDISKFVKQKIAGTSKHISQMSAASRNYTGPDPKDLKRADRKEFEERMKRRGDNPIEKFRYYKGAPDGAGSRRR